MADERELFSILEESDGSGAGLSKKQAGDAASGANEAPVLPAEDASGNLQHIPRRSVGNTAGDGVAVHAFQDGSGNHVYPKVDSSGNLRVTLEDDDIEVYGNGTVAGVIGTKTLVASVALIASDTYKATLALGACTQPCLWTVEQKDDATFTTLAQFITGPGQYSYDMDLGITVTAGATGAQEIRVSGTQLRGPSSDMHATVKSKRVI